MKKILFSAALGFSALSFSQQAPVREVYNYTAKNDRALIKAKTDLFLLNVISSKKFTVDPISSADDHLDLHLIMPIAEGKISSRVRYDFMKEGFVVSLSNTKLIGKDKKTIAINNEKDANHKKILDNLKNLLFRVYEKELSK
ncbi:MAG: hypothetical protein K0M63_07660 [Weeksellaceae bacterium]|nr:hypothetical protein [Weeksellaceae bacterium]